MRFPRWPVALSLLAWTIVSLGSLSVALAGPPDSEDALQAFNRDVYFLDGVTLRNPTADTPDEESLYSELGQLLPVTWGEWRAASASSTVKVTGGLNARATAAIQFTGLIPNGVYSVFYGTVQPDSEHPDCPGVERTLPLTSVLPGQMPDASSFVADASGNAFFVGRVEGDLLAAEQLFFSLVYHFDGSTYHPFPNRGEFLTHETHEVCVSTYGQDAMRQLLILQKF